MKKKKTNVDPQRGSRDSALSHQRPASAAPPGSVSLDEAAFRFLTEASLQLAASLDYESTLATVTRLAVSGLADYCLVDLLTTSGRLGRVASVHTDPAEAALLKPELRYPPDPEALDHPVAQVLRTGESVLHHEIVDPQIQLPAHEPEHLRLAYEPGLTSGMVVPLIAHEQILGTLSLGVVRQGRQYTATDLAVAETFARHAALALVNARRYKEAQEGLRAREQFLSIAAHELKNPLTTLLGSIEHLQRRLSKMAEAQERDHQIARRIRDQTIRLTQMIDSLLDIARVESGRFSLVRAPIDLAAIVRHLVAEIQAASTRHCFTVTVLDDPLIVYGDAVRLEQVFQNLLSNAIKYSPNGGPITVELARRGPAATVVVTDEGIGIPQAAIPYLFQRFFRAPNVDRRQIDGIGLGLAIVKEIVTLHGGEVEVVSEEHRGSTFTVVLPLHDADGSATPLADADASSAYSYSVESPPVA